MRALLDRLANSLHALIALLALWLVASSPWLGLYDRVPAAPGFVNGSHVVLGLALLPLAVLYCAACTLGGRWRLYFPWLAGHFGDIGRDLGGLARGERPGAEGGGLFATLEGLLLLALLAAAASGALWLVASSIDTVTWWRSVHSVAARIFAALMLLHVVAVSLHLLDLIRR